MSAKRFYSFRTGVFVTTFIWLMLAPSLTWADLKLPAFISDNMVLQQRSKVPIWGWAEAGEEIRITTSWDSQVFETITDPNGLWKTKIITPPAGGPYKLTNTGV